MQLTRVHDSHGGEDERRNPDEKDGRNGDVGVGSAPVILDDIETVSLNGVVYGEGCQTPSPCTHQSDKEENSRRPIQRKGTPKHRRVSIICLRRLSAGVLRT